MIRVWSSRRSAAPPEFTPRVTSANTPATRNASPNCSLKCRARPAEIARRISSASSLWLARERFWPSSPTALKENCSKRRAARRASATIPFSSSLPSARHLPNSPRKKRIFTATAAKRFASSWPLSLRRFSCAIVLRSDGRQEKSEDKKALQKSAACEGCEKRGNKSEARPRDPRKARCCPSRRDLRAGSRQSISIADFHDPLRAVHRRARQSGHPDAL